MKKHFTVAIAILVLTACGPDPAEFWNAELNPLLVEFANQDDLAASTPRGDLSPIISQMVATRTRIQVLSESDATPKCARSGMSVLLSSTSSVISAAQDWVSIEFGWSEQEVDEHDQRVVREWTSADEALQAAQATIKADCDL